MTPFCGTHPSCLWPGGIISSVQPPVFSLLIESLPNPTGMFKVAAMEINHLTPFPDPKDLPSLPLLPRRWVGTGGGGGAETVRRRQGRRIKGSRWVIRAAEATPPQSEATPPPSERTASAEPWLILTSQAEKNDLYILLNIQLIACVCVHVCVLALVSGPTGRWCSVRSTCHGAESLIDAWCF